MIVEELFFENEEYSDLTMSDAVYHVELGAAFEDGTWRTYDVYGKVPLSVLVNDGLKEWAEKALRVVLEGETLVLCATWLHCYGVADLVMLEEEE